MILSEEPWTDHQRLQAPDDGAALWWLGQAGFLIEMDGSRIVIDPYLSDVLAEKYRGAKFPHMRMTPAPVTPGALVGVDWLLCTHGHTDHMDPGAIPALLAANPRARVVVPASQRALALSRGAPADRCLTVDVGDRLALSDEVELIATPAAHETLDRDAEGRSLYLGYALRGRRTTLWHSGDTIPFPGLVEAVAPLGVDIALLPVNGRDAERAANGVPGNLTLEEAVTLNRRIGAKAMLGHHLDLFAFNTLDRDDGDAWLKARTEPGEARLATLHTRYAVTAPPKHDQLSVLMVCRGNICRSPMAEGIFRDLIGGRPDWIVDSAAIEDWNVGAPPDHRAIRVATRRGLDIRAQRARQIRTTDFARFDLILAMDAENLSALRQCAPKRPRARVLLLGNCAELGRDAEIVDPYTGDEADFDSCFEVLERSLAALARNLIR